MQGSFNYKQTSLNTDWGTVLDPGPDENAIAEYRNRQEVARLNQVRASRYAAAQDGAGGGAAPAPAAGGGDGAPAGGGGGDGGPAPAAGGGDGAPAGGGGGDGGPAPAAGGGGDGAPAAAGPAPPPPVQSIAPPQANSTVFQVKTHPVYVLTKAVNNEAPFLGIRKGVYGHYLVPYEEFQANGKKQAKPYREQPLANSPSSIKPKGPPGTIEGDQRPPPSPEFCEEGTHYVCPDTPHHSPYWEVGLNVLRSLLENAEALDLAFAQRMQGLSNVTRIVVWDCLDPDYDPTDRKPVMQQFMAKYLDRFYTRMQPGNVPDVLDLSEEALHKHKTFCKAWVKKHYCTLTPNITGPAEALANEFFPYLQGQMPRDNRLTRLDLARILMRHEDFSAEFAICLHYYSMNLEHSRSARNASYKQMSSVTGAKIWSYNQLGNLLGQKAATLNSIFRRLNDPVEAAFDPLLVDWYGILGQIPQVHKYFDDDAAQQAGIGRLPRSSGAGQVPPWRVGRSG